MDIPEFTFAAPRARGVALQSFLVVLAVVVIAAVAFQIMRQRRGAGWRAAGASPAGALPRCLAPGDVAYVEGRVDVYPGLPGFVGRCRTYRVGTPTAAPDVVSLLGGAACGPAGGGPLWYQGTGTYSCHSGGARRDRFYWGDAAERENYSQRWRRHHGGREGFSPDEPGACSGASRAWQKHSRAAALEAEALQVAAGLS